MASIALRPLSPIIFPPKPCNLPTEDDFRFAWAYRNAVEKAMFIGRPAGLRPAHLVDAYAYETKVYMALFVNDVPSQGQEIRELMNFVRTKGTHLEYLMEVIHQICEGARSGSLRFVSSAVPLTLTLVSVVLWHAPS
ncbi:hypothetical protein SCP_1000020 [Sparassis crispa]|uniref:Uncharacterized protein n=1 Tax=Sparassis crispa TaxID=139825 RepID=A0A401GX50_9APHY|nr:hypothetical protein SCP_1000020 [Sparassis crispa]GBE86760.1 hypothetical protein SCP_1000020 [Sparassis crispa]